MCISRIILALLVIFWMFFSPSTAFPQNTLVHHILNVFPNNDLFSLVSPTLCTELCVDTFLLMGVWSSSPSCLVPWILLNILIMLGLGGGVVFHLLSVFIPAVEQESANINKVEAAIKDIHRFIIIILLNIFLALQMLSVSAVVRLFVQLKRKKISYVFQSDFVDKEIIMTSKENDQQESCESDDKIQKRPKGPIPLINLAENDKKRDSWETLRFSYEEDFA